MVAVKGTEHMVTVDMNMEIRIFQGDMLGAEDK